MEFIENMDKLFDYFNVSCYSAGRKAWKGFQMPYTKPNDYRLTLWVEKIHIILKFALVFEIFIDYLDW